VVIVGAGETAQLFGPFADEDAAREALRSDPHVATAVTTDKTA
jgi:hypothetical protein